MWNVGQLSAEEQKEARWYIGVQPRWKREACGESPTVEKKVKENVDKVKILKNKEIRIILK